MYERKIERREKKKVSREDDRGQTEQEKERERKKVTVGAL